MKYPLLKFDGAVKKDPAIEAWFLDRPPELSAIALKWFRKMRNCGPDVLEVLHDGFPTLCVENAPFAYVNVFSSHLNVGFFHGASLRDPAHVLQGTGKYMRHIKLKPGALGDEVALENLVKAAYADIKERLKG